MKPYKCIKMSYECAHSALQTRPSQKVLQLYFKISGGKLLQHFEKEIWHGLYLYLTASEVILHVDTSFFFSALLQTDVFSIRFFLCFFKPDLLNFKKGWMVKLDEQGQVLYELLNLPFFFYHWFSKSRVKT